jgi:hypothetical protein
VHSAAFLARQPENVRVLVATFSTTLAKAMKVKLGPAIAFG